MSKHVLITGGAGFIGSHLCSELLEHDYKVRVIDNLCSQVHGKLRTRPAHLVREVELIEGDIRDPDVVTHALRGVDAVVHLAAAIGGRQSMRQLSYFTEINNLGTAVLLEAMQEEQVRRMVLASSMVVYGEGLYCTADGAEVDSVSRSEEQLASAQWEPRDDEDNALTPMPTPERKAPSLNSVYAVSKFDQEQMCLMAGAEQGVATTVLRLFSVYGPRQLPVNPYSGRLSAYAASICADEVPAVDEDGYQLRDWVSVHDVARAFRLALECENPVCEAINIGSGIPSTALDVARQVAEVLGHTDVEPEATGRWRKGQVRHCYADISKARDLLGFDPQVDFEAGLQEMAEWLSCVGIHQAALEEDREPALRGLVV